MIRLFRKLYFAFLAMGLGAACAATGPVEVLSDVEAGEDISCFRVSSCVEQGSEKAAAGRYPEARPYLIEACERGAAKGCRLLADAHVLGALGEPDPEFAAALYQWSCEHGDDATSCHLRGELARLGFVEDDDEETRRYFERACDGGNVEGCHDAAIVGFVAEELDETRAEEILQVFENACEQGLSVGCVNQGYMKAAGLATGRDHFEAAELFEAECHAGPERWQPHRMASVVPEGERDVYSVTEYAPKVACEQLEVLVVGGYEERIIAAFEAESDELRTCYDSARPVDEEWAGRITIEADIGPDGDGIEPRIVDDELGLDALAACVEQMLRRHLQDRSEGEALYSTRWGISFVHSPAPGDVDGEDDGDSEENEGQPQYGCDVDEVQMAISEAFSDLRRCGTRHIEAHPGDPGAVVTWWTFGLSGGVDQVAMSTTVDDEGLGVCLQETISSLEISPFDGQACPVQLPFLFSSSQGLHFSVVGR